MTYTQAQIQESRAHARNLAAALSGGWRPDPIRTPIQLQQNEHCYAQEPTQVWQYLGGDGSYILTGGGGSGLLGMAMVAGTAVGNVTRRRRAAREAAPRFRPVDQGTLYMTDKRFAIQGQTQWTDLWYEHIRMASCDSNSITLHMANEPPMQLYVWPCDYHFALYHFLANGEIIEIPPDLS